jgi:hypothetical protein
MAATHECSACLKETIKGADFVEPPLVLSDSICSAPGGRHSWTKIGMVLNSFSFQNIL